MCVLFYIYYPQYSLVGDSKPLIKMTVKEWNKEYLEQYSLDTIFRTHAQEINNLIEKIKDLEKKFTKLSEIIEHKTIKPIKIKGWGKPIKPTENDRI